MLSETWLSSLHEDKLIFRKGFKMFRQDRDSMLSKRGGGLLIYVREELALYCNKVENNSR